MKTQCNRIKFGYLEIFCGRGLCHTFRGVFILCDKIVRGDLLVENVFYDPLRLDGEKPLCDESAGISPQDSNSKQQCAPSN